MKETNVAIAVDATLTRKKYNVLPIFRSMERDYKMLINASWSGVSAFIGENRIYKHGTYTPTAAQGGEQRLRYRLRILRFLQWLNKNYPTPELTEALPWLEEQDEW